MFEGRKKRFVFSVIYIIALFVFAVAMGAMAFFAMAERDYVIMGALLAIAAILIMLISFHAISATRRGNVERFYLDKAFLIFFIFLFLVFAGALAYYYLAR